MNHARVAMFLPEPRESIWTEPGLSPLLSLPVDATAASRGRAPVWLHVHGFMQASNAKRDTLLKTTGRKNTESAGVFSCAACALQWAHHIAALASGPVVVLYYQKPDVFTGEQRVLAYTVEPPVGLRVSLRSTVPLWPATLLWEDRMEQRPGPLVELRCGTIDTARDLVSGCDALLDSASLADK
eukprot:5760616-Prymnesium_polylepis.3